MNAVSNIASKHINNYADTVLAYKLSWYSYFASNYSCALIFSCVVGSIVYIYMYVWQSRVENEHYSVAYFDRCLCV